MVNWKHIKLSSFFQGGIRGAGGGNELLMDLIGDTNCIVLSMHDPNYFQIFKSNHGALIKSNFPILPFTFDHDVASSVIPATPDVAKLCCVVPHNSLTRSDRPGL